VLPNVEAGNTMRDDAMRDDAMRDDRPPGAALDRVPPPADMPAPKPGWSGGDGGEASAVPAAAPPPSGATAALGDAGGAGSGGRDAAPDAPAGGAAELGGAGGAMSGERAAGEAAPARPVNKRELAMLLGVASATIDAAMMRHPDRFPVVVRGNQGAAWQFDPIAVRRFLDELDELDRAEAVARQKTLEQYGLALKADPKNVALPDGLDAKTVSANVKAMSDQDKLLTARGFLVLTADMRRDLQAALAEWNQAEFAALRQVGTRANLPEAVTRELESTLADVRNRFCDRMRKALKSGQWGNGDGPTLFDAA
jgi:hypothetical protein